LELFHYVHYCVEKYEHTSFSVKGRFLPMSCYEGTEGKKRSTSILSCTQ